MNCEITIEYSKSYATRENLEKALKRMGLWQMGCRFIICRNSEGRWTAVFLVSEFINKEGGYIGLASQFGFMSV